MPVPAAKALALAGAVAGTVLIAPAHAAVAAGLPGRCAGAGPIACDYDVPPGDYTVTAVLGGRGAAAVTGVVAQARRRMVAPVATAAGRRAVRTFTVNVRDPEAQPTGDSGVGTPGLHLLFDGSAPRLSRLTVRPARHPRSLYLIGDSTVCDWLDGPKHGWGQFLTQYAPSRVAVANYADSGESTGSYLADPALFPTVRALLGPGDEVLIQLAHNDKTVPKADYQANLTALVDGVRATGARPVLVTPPVRRLFGPDGKLTPTGLIVNNLGVDLPAAMREVAAAERVPLIDLTARSQALVESLGPDASQALYLTLDRDGVTDNTHFSEYGADRMARLVREGPAGYRP